MVPRAKIDAWSSTLMIVGCCFIAAGAFVPSEETMALGVFLLLAPMAVLVGLHWPKSQPDNLVSLRTFRSTRRPRA